MSQHIHATVIVQFTECFKISLTVHCIIVMFPLQKQLFINLPQKISQMQKITSCVACSVAYTICPPPTGGYFCNRDAPITHWPIIGRQIIGAKQSADYRLIQKVPETVQKPAVHTV